MATRYAAARLQTTAPRGSLFGADRGSRFDAALQLSQVIGFAKQAGGDVHVESELGAGSTFTIYLPRVYGDTTQPVVSDETEIRHRCH